VAGYGGKRENAGRKPGTRNRNTKDRKLELDDVAKKVLSSIDSVGVWTRLLTSNSPKTVFAALSYLTDRVHGRPAQTIQGSIAPVQIEFSLAGWANHPEWLDGKPERLPAKVIPQIAESLQQVIDQIEDEHKE
jgi:hypothetical protein